MNNQLITYGIVFILLIVGLSGCSDFSNNKEIKEFFTLSGTITNNYMENIEIDYAIVTESIDDSRTIDDIP